jgi:hypothetical protein
MGRRCVCLFGRLYGFFQTNNDAAAQPAGAIGAGPQDRFSVEESPRRPGGRRGSRPWLTTYLSSWSADMAGLAGAGIIHLVIDQESTERRPGYEHGQRPRAGVIDKPHWLHWTRFRLSLVADDGGQPISFGSAHGQLLDLGQGLVHVAGESVIPLLDSRAKERGVAS